MSTTNTPTTCLHTFRPGEVRCVCGAHRHDCDCPQCEPAASIQCPAWCTDHSREHDGTPILHRSAELGRGFGVDLYICHDIEPGGLVGPYVDLLTKDCQLTPIEAGRLALALLRAANLAEPGTFVRALVEAMEVER